MNDNFIEGVQDKTARGLRAILTAQANVRLYVAIPVILCELVLMHAAPAGIPGWFAALAGSYCIYALTPYLLIRGGSHASLLRLLIASAVFDPVVLTVWIALTNEYGSLIAGFYLFTMLGFGFRTGRPLMHLCQIASIIGFAAVLICSPYWQQHSVFWIALLVPMIVVPMYAGILIKSLRASRERAELESRGKSELLAKVSHELRTPLTGIVAATELLAIESSNNSAVARRAETILTLSDGLLCEINDLLDEAKYAAATLALEHVPVDLNHEFDTLRNTFEPLAAKKNLAFRATIDPAINGFVSTDPHHLARIMTNLAGNAIKFTEAGSVTLAINLLEQTVIDYRLRFSVADTGIGIPDSFLAKMFEPFAQVEQGTQRRYGGTGLGLALSKKIVEQLGGELRFERAGAKGSRFWFDLTLARTVAPASETHAKPQAEIVSPKRILLVEDNATNLLLTQELLKIDQHQVTLCDSGIGALELLAKHDFDLILLDYNLGDMDGVRLLQTYRFGQPRPAPALFITADATAQTATRLIEAGSAGILYKPVKLAAIRNALAQIHYPATGTAPSASARPAAAEAGRTERPTLKVVPISPLDHKVLDELRNVSTQHGFLPMLLSHADDDITRCSQQLVEALSDKTYAAIPNIAHALKGVCANIGAIRLATLASTLMNLSSDELDSSRERLGIDIRESSQATLLALRKVVAETGQASARLPGLLHLD